MRRPVAALLAMAAAASLAVTTSVLTGAPAQAEGRVIYVAPWGSDFPSGAVPPPNSAEHPWSRMFLAVLHARPGDRIVVRGGTYVESVGWHASPGRAEAPITLEAAEGERVVLKGTLQLVGADYWTVRGINVTSDPARGRTEFLVKFDGGRGWQFLDSEVWGTRGVSNLFVGGSSRVASDYRIAGNCIHDNLATGDPYMNDHNIYLMPGYTSGPGVIERNIVFNSPNGAGIKAAGNSRATGAADVVIRDNTIANTGAGITIAYGSNRIRVTGNLIGPRAPGGIAAYDAAVVGNHVWGADNVVADNAVGGFAAMVRSTKDSTPGLKSTGSVRVSPEFDAVDVCSGYHPTDPAATRFGRYH